MPGEPRLWGLMAEFASPAELLDAARSAREEGYTRMDAYTPFPIEELAEALGFRRTRLPLIVLVGGLVGLVGGYFLQYYAAVVDYPLNVGGRPFHSWPAFIVPTFEMTILGASFAAVLGMLGMNKLPEPYHPVFNAPRFALASRDRFFLAIEAKDPRFDRDETWAFLTRLGPRVVMDVEE